MDILAQSERKAFIVWVRTGRWRRSVAPAASAHKFNQNHDPANGRFSFGSGTGLRGTSTSVDVLRRPKRFYTGMTATGVGPIKPTSGGHIDRSGKYVPEVFSPDPYRLTDPASALAHYVGGTGEDRNLYLNSLDTSAVTVEDFPKIVAALNSAKPGTYVFNGTKIKSFDSGRPFKPHKLSAAATVGRLGMQADGTLTIRSDGRYAFNGVIGVDNEHYRSPIEKGRTKPADQATWVGRQLPGKEFRVHIIGRHPLHEVGHIRVNR